MLHVITYHTWAHWMQFTLCRCSKQKVNVTVLECCPSDTHGQYPAQEMHSLSKKTGRHFNAVNFTIKDTFLKKINILLFSVVRNCWITTIVAPVRIWMTFSLQHHDLENCRTIWAIPLPVTFSTHFQIPNFVLYQLVKHLVICLSRFQSNNQWCYSSK